MLTEKTCTKCGITKPIEEFYRKRSTKDGLRPECKSCTKAVNDKYKKANRDYLNEKKREYREANRELIRAKNAEYRDRNRDVIRERAREWSRRNAEKRREYGRLRYLENKEIISRKIKEWNERNRWSRRQREERRRTRKLELLADFTREDWNRCLDAFNHSCAYCGSKGDLQQDHFVPLSKGGPYTRTNIVPACVSCNSSKGNRDFFEWYPRTPHYSAERVLFICEYTGTSNSEEAGAV